MRVSKKRKVLREMYCPEGIMDMREVQGKVEYLIKWLHFSHSENTWEPPEHLTSISASLWAFHIRKMEDVRYSKRKKGICDTLIGRTNHGIKRVTSGPTHRLNLNTVLEAKRESAKTNSDMKDLTPQDYFRLTERIYRLKTKINTSSQDHLVNQVIRMHKLFDRNLCFSLRMVDGSITDCLEQDMEQHFPFKMCQYLTTFLPVMSAVMIQEINEYEDALKTLKRRGRIMKQREKCKREDQIAALKGRDIIDAIKNEAIQNKVIGDRPKSQFDRRNKTEEIFEEED